MNRFLLVLAAVLLGVPALAQEKADKPYTCAWISDIRLLETVHVEVTVSPEAETGFFDGMIMRAEREALVAVMQTRMSMSWRCKEGIAPVLLRVKTEGDCYGYCYDSEGFKNPLRLNIEEFLVPTADP